MLEDVDIKATWEKYRNHPAITALYEQLLRADEIQTAAGVEPVGNLLGDRKKKYRKASRNQKIAMLDELRKEYSEERAERYKRYQEVYEHGLNQSDSYDLGMSGWDRLKEESEIPEFLAMALNDKLRLLGSHLHYSNNKYLSADLAYRSLMGEPVPDEMSFVDIEDDDDALHRARGLQRIINKFNAGDARYVPSEYWPEVSASSLAEKGTFAEVVEFEGTHYAASGGAYHGDMSHVSGYALATDEEWPFNFRTNKMDKLGNYDGVGMTYPYRKQRYVVTSTIDFYGRPLSYFEKQLEHIFQEFPGVEQALYQDDQSEESPLGFNTYLEWADDKIQRDYDLELGKLTAEDLLDGQEPERKAINFKSLFYYRLQLPTSLHGYNYLKWLGETYPPETEEQLDEFALEMARQAKRIADEHSGAREYLESYLGRTGHTQAMDLIDRGEVMRVKARYGVYQVSTANTPNYDKGYFIVNENFDEQLHIANRKSLGTVIGDLMNGHFDGQPVPASEQVTPTLGEPAVGESNDLFAQAESAPRSEALSASDDTEKPATETVVNEGEHPIAVDPLHEPTAEPVNDPAANVESLIRDAFQKQRDLLGGSTVEELLDADIEAVRQQANNDASLVSTVERMELTRFEASEDAIDVIFGVDQLRNRQNNLAMYPRTLSAVVDCMNAKVSVQPDSAAVDELDKLPAPQDNDEVNALAQFSIYRVSNRILVRGDGRNGFGDTIHETLADAEDYASIERKRFEERQAARQRIEQKELEEEAEKLNRSNDSVNGFTDELPKMRAAKVKKNLDALINFGDDIGIMTKRQRVESLAAYGDLRIETIEEPRIKPMSRLRYFRADQAEQEAHEQLMRDAGNKTVYLVNGSDLGKTAYDYAVHLLGQDVTLEAAADQQSSVLGELSESKHTKTGETIHVMPVEQRMEVAQFKEAVKKAKSAKGGYWRGEFFFRTVEDAVEFRAWLDGSSPELAETQNNEADTGQDDNQPEQEASTVELLYSSTVKPFKSESGARRSKAYKADVGASVVAVEGGFAVAPTGYKEPEVANIERAKEEAEVDSVTAEISAITGYINKYLKSVGLPEGALSELNRADVDFLFAETPAKHRESMRDYLRDRVDLKVEFTSALQWAVDDAARFSGKYQGQPKEAFIRSDATLEQPPIEVVEAGNHALAETGSDEAAEVISVKQDEKDAEATTLSSNPLAHPVGAAIGSHQFDSIRDQLGAMMSEGSIEGELIKHGYKQVIDIVADNLAGPMANATARLMRLFPAYLTAGEIPQEQQAALEQLAAAFVCYAESRPFELASQHQQKQSEQEVATIEADIPLESSQPAQESGTQEFTYGSDTQRQAVRVLQDNLRAKGGEVNLDAIVGGGNLDKAVFGTVKLPNSSPAPVLINRNGKLSRLSPTQLDELRERLAGAKTVHIGLDDPEVSANHVDNDCSAALAKEADKQPDTAITPNVVLTGIPQIQKTIIKRVMSESDYIAISADNKGFWSGQVGEPATWGVVKDSYIGKRTVVDQETGKRLVDGLDMVIVPDDLVDEYEWLNDDLLQALVTETLGDRFVDTKGVLLDELKTFEAECALDGDVELGFKACSLMAYLEDEQPPTKEQWMLSVGIVGTASGLALNP